MKKTAKFFCRFARREKSRRSAIMSFTLSRQNQDRVKDALLEDGMRSAPAAQVKYGEPNNFDIKTADNFIEQFDSIIGGVGLTAIAISCLGLLVGGIGVMNIMLVSVTERTKEIGIRKAIGATKGAIVLQFLLEAMTLTFFGGILGVTLAVGISNLIMLLVPSLPGFDSAVGSDFGFDGFGRRRLDFRRSSGAKGLKIRPD